MNAPNDLDLLLTNVISQVWKPLSDWVHQVFLLQFPDQLKSGIAAVSLAASVLFWIAGWRTSRKIAERTVTIEAQKLLLEINKQLLSNPHLFAIYDDDYEKCKDAYFATTKSQQCPNDLELSLRALALMNLNIFEIVFAVHPRGAERKGWEMFFKDSLRTSKPIVETLRNNRFIYSDRLIRTASKLAPESIQYVSPVRALGRKTGSAIECFMQSICFAEHGARQSRSASEGLEVVPSPPNSSGKVKENIDLPADTLNALEMDLQQIQ